MGSEAWRWRVRRWGARVVLLLAAAATLANGMLFFLRRVGVVDPRHYETYQRDFVRSDPDYERTPGENEALRVFTARLYESRGWWAAGKLAKDAVMALAVALGLAGMGLGWGGVWAGWGWSRRLALVLLGYVGVLAVVSWMRHGPWLAVAGLRTFGFLVVGATCGWWYGRRESALAGRLLLGVLGVQAALVPVEWWRGMHLFGVRFFGMAFGDRAVGTMLQPASLGVLAVVVAAHVLGGQGRPWEKVLALGLALWLVLASASATAAILAAVVVAATAWRAWHGARGAVGVRGWRMSACIAVAALLLGVCAWPALTGRTRLASSVWGRVSIAVDRLGTGGTWWEWLIGRGLGAGTNASANLLMDWEQGEASTVEAGLVFIPDSTPVAMTSQAGLLGLALWYGMLGCAWGRRDGRGRRMFWGVVLLGSLTLSIGELWPVNVLMGLELGRERSGAEG